MKRKFDAISTQVPTRPNPECASEAESMSDRACDVSHREDLTDRFTLTINPKTCQDMEDAVSLKHIEGSLFELGVHITDVDEYVKKDSTIDRNANRRGKSYYAATGAVYHMLPERLATELCSLTQGLLFKIICISFNIISELENSNNYRFIELG